MCCNPTRSKIFLNLCVIVCQGRWNGYVESSINVAGYKWCYWIFLPVNQLQPPDPPVIIPKYFFLPTKIQPTRHLRSTFQIQNGYQVENGSAVPSQSTSPTSPLSKSTPNCLFRASFRNSLSSYRTWHSHSSFLSRCSKRMSLMAKSSRPCSRHSSLKSQPRFSVPIPGIVILTAGPIFPAAFDLYLL